MSNCDEEVLCKIVTATINLGRGAKWGKVNEFTITDYDTFISSICNASHHEIDDIVERLNKLFGGGTKDIKCDKIKKSFETAYPLCKVYEDDLEFNNIDTEFWLFDSRTDVYSLLRNADSENDTNLFLVRKSSNRDHLVISFQKDNKITETRICQDIYTGKWGICIDNDNMIGYPGMCKEFHTYNTLTDLITNAFGFDIKNCIYKV